MPEVLCIRRDSAQLAPLLLEGRVFKEGKSWAVLPREWVNSSGNEEESIVFEVVPVEALMKPSKWRVFQKAIRMESLTMTLSPGVSIFLFGLCRGWTPHLWVGFLALLGVISFQIAVNLFNDVEDHLRLVDLPGTLKGSGVLQKGWLSAQRMQFFAYCALGVGILFGLPAVFVNPTILLGIGIASAVAVISYSNRPFGMKYRLGGDFLIFFFSGPLLALGLSQAIFQTWEAGVLELGFCFGFLSWAIFHAHRLQDLGVQDSKTLSSRLGFQKSRYFLSILHLLAFGAIFYGILAHDLPLVLTPIFALGIPQVVQLNRLIYKASGPSSALLGNIRSDAARLHIRLGFLLGVGFLLSLF